MHRKTKAHKSLLENRMPKNYGNIWRTDQSTPQTNYRKYLMSSKENRSWAILADFGLSRCEVDETRHISTKKSRSNPLAIKWLLESNWKFLRKSVVREKFNLRLDPQMRKLIPFNDATIFTNIIKWKRSCIQFSSFMSWQYLSTSSKTCMHLKNFKFFCSLRRPETHIRTRHTAHHQRAGIFLGSIDMIQVTNIRVNGVEHKKRVNKKNKLGKRTNWFSEAIKKAKFEEACTYQVKLHRID